MGSNGTTTRLPLHPKEQWQPFAPSVNRSSFCWAEGIRTCPGKNSLALVHQRVERVILFGEAAEKIAAALEQASGPLQKTVEHCKDLQEAVITAARISRPGEIVLLSPGGTSFDQFRDFEERGEAFRKWVLELS